MPGGAPEVERDGAFRKSGVAVLARDVVGEARADGAVGVGYGEGGFHGAQVFHAGRAEGQEAVVVGADVRMDAEPGMHGQGAGRRMAEKSRFRVFQ